MKTLVLEGFVVLSYFWEVSWKTLVEEAWILTFCESLEENTFWEASLSVFVRAKVSGKTLVLEGLILSFCESLMGNARFESLPQFLRKPRGKRLFGKSSSQVRGKRSFWKCEKKGGKRKERE